MRNHSARPGAAARRLRPASRAWTRLGLVAVAAFTAGCSGYLRAPDTPPPAPPPERGESYANELRDLIDRADIALNDLVSRYAVEIEGIRDQFIADLARLEPPARLAAVDRTLRAYGAAAEERYLAAIDRLVDDAVERTIEIVGRERRHDSPAVIGRVEVEAWELAREVGGGSTEGSGYGFESGVAEIDERAAVTIELLQGIADIQNIRDLGEIRKAELLRLTRYFHHDATEQDLAEADPAVAARLAPVDEGASERVGRFLLFRSDVLEEQRFPNQDTFGVVVAYQNDRLPLDMRLGLVQASRFRVVRGGMVVQDFGWRLDPQSPGKDGRLPNNRDLIDSRFLASECFFPAVNVDHSLFKELYDFQVVFDYKSALVDESRRSVLGAMSWQISWIVSHNGQVRLLDNAPPSYDAAGEIVQRLIAAGPSPLPGQREATVTDLSPQRYSPTEPAVQPMKRDLGGGRSGTIATHVGADQLRVSADGRAFLARNRLRLVAADARFNSYHDGVRGRFVLRITDIVDDSPLLDLGLRPDDDIHAINDVPIRDFQDLWTFFTEHPRERQYRVRLNRMGAIRQLVYEVEGVPASSAGEPSAEDLTEEMVERLNRLFRQSAGE